MIGVVMREGRRQRQTQESRPRDAEAAVRVMQPQVRTVRAACTTSRGERLEGPPRSWLSEGASPCLHLDFRRLASRTGRGCSRAVLASQDCGTSLQQPWGLMQVPTLFTTNPKSFLGLQALCDQTGSLPHLLGHPHPHCRCPGPGCLGLLAAPFFLTEPCSARHLLSVPSEELDTSTSDFP